MYRVQAELDDTGTALCYSNTGGSVHNQLIELVDPDGAALNMSGVAQITVISAEGEQWGCVLRAGDSVTPTTSPSTNFYESATAPTGLAVRVTASDQESGTVSVSYQDTTEQDPADLSFTVEGVALSHAGTITLTSSLSLMTTQAYRLWLPVAVAVGSKTYPGTAKVSDRTVEVCFAVDSSEFTGPATAHVTFGAESLVVAVNPDGSLVYAPETTVDVPLDQDGHVALATASGLYQSPADAHLRMVTDVEACADGTLCFFTAQGGNLFVNRVDPATRGLVFRTKVGGDQPLAAPDTAEYTARVLPTQGSEAVLVVAGTDGSVAAYWVDTATGAVTAHADVTAAAGMTGALKYVVSDRTLVAGVTGYAADSPTGQRLNLVACTPDGTGGCRQASAFLNTDRAADILQSDGQTMGIANEMGGSDAPAQANVYSLPAVVDAIDAAAASGTELQLPAAAAQQQASGCLSIADMAALPGQAGYVLVANLVIDDRHPAETKEAIRFDAAGKQTARTEVVACSPAVPTAAGFNRIRVAPDGSLAVMRCEQDRSKPYQYQEVALVSADLGTVRYVTTLSKSFGTWLSDSTWYCVGWTMDRAVAGWIVGDNGGEPAGSAQLVADAADGQADGAQADEMQADGTQAAAADTEDVPVRWYTFASPTDPNGGGGSDAGTDTGTDDIDADDGDDPENENAPDDEGAGDAAGPFRGVTLIRTGDAMAGAIAVLAVLAVAGAVAAVVARRRTRR